MRRLLAALLLIAPLPALADESAAFLKIGLGARALGMGGAQTAVADDVTALGWNPAGLSTLVKKEAGVSHTQLTGGTRYDFIGYAQPLRHGTLAAGAVHLSQNSLSGRDAQGRPLGDFGASDTSINLGYAAKLSRGFLLGGAIKYVRSSISNISAQTGALDLGGQYELAQLGPGMPRLGAAVLNLGPGMTFLNQASPLPLTVALGLGYRLPVVGLTLALDYKNRPHGRNSEINIGMEYAVLSSFALRAGYNRLGGGSSSSPGKNALASLNGMAAGFGLKALSYTLDYSTTPFGELGNAQRLSLGAKF